MFQVINLNEYPVSVLLDTPAGEGADYAYVQGRGRVTLSEGLTVNRNWLVNEPKVKVTELSQPTA